MENKVAIMSIIVNDGEQVEKINSLLHDNGGYIIGRMGIPYRAKNIHIISIALDAPQEVIDALAAQIGVLPGVGVKTVAAAE